jgi:glycosyltransferase involved in cell wall biosynthesis
MNCYNSSLYLKEALDSILNQTYNNWEIIFWDNQSIDASEQIFKSYDEPRFRYFYSKKHTKLGEARNSAISMTNGEFLAFLDCDDVWTSKKLEKQINLLSSNVNAGLCYCKTSDFKENFEINSQKNIELPTGDIFKKLLFENFITLSSAVIRKSIFIQVGGINGKLVQAEDYDIFLKIAKKYDCLLLDEVSCKYRIHNYNHSKFQSKESLSESLFVISLFKNNTSLQLINESIDYWILRKSKSLFKIAPIFLLQQAFKYKRIKIFIILPYLYIRYIYEYINRKVKYIFIKFK